MPNQDQEMISERTPLVANTPSISQHLGGHRQYWRDMILGANDGLISTLLLVVGVAGGGMSSEDVLLTAISGAVAGAVSMFAGEFVATKSQNEVLHGELRLEAEHIDKYPEDELNELMDLLPIIGISDPTIKEMLISHYRSNKTALLQAMKALEFGVVDAEVRSPFKAGSVSFLLFLTGSVPSIAPFVFVDDSKQGAIAAAAGTCVCLLIVGIFKTWATRGVFWKAAAENLTVTGIGGALAFAVGLMFDAIVRDHDTRPKF